MKLFRFLKRLFYKFRYYSSQGSIIYALAIIDIKSTTRLPLDYLWGERYLNWIEYLKRRGEGIDCTYEDVEDEYLENWHKKFKDAQKRFWEEREKHPNANDWWT